MTPADEKENWERRRTLLEEGARSYLDAVSALIAYQSEVQSICRKVMEKHLRDYASALKVSLDKSELTDATVPTFKDWGGDWWGLGVKIIRKGITPEIHWWEFYCYLSYDGDNGIHCWVGEWFPTQQIASELFQRFQPLSKKVERDGNHLWIIERLTDDEVCSLDLKLDSIVQQWIAIWKRVGGIEKAFKRVNRKSVAPKSNFKS